MARILLEAHHPAHVHFWKYPIRELQARGHSVLMVARDRDVMRRLLEQYEWIEYRIPKRPTTRNRFPLREMIERQVAVASAINEFRPHLVASLMGSYCQSASIFGINNIIFTDTETQSFNHRIAHPFASEVHTPFCFEKDLGPKQKRYAGIHELAFLSPKYFTPDPGVLCRYGDLRPNEYVLLRLSAWNTLHDRARAGFGREIVPFVEELSERFRILLSAEENKVPEGLERFQSKLYPEDFHHLLAFARLVITEGASTAAEAACLGTPSVFVNSTEPLGNFRMLEERGLVQSFQSGDEGVRAARNVLARARTQLQQEFVEARDRLLAECVNVCAYVVEVCEAAADG